jgi:hypothetical protein
MVDIDIDIDADIVKRAKPQPIYTGGSPQEPPRPGCTDLISTRSG